MGGGGGVAVRAVGGAAVWWEEAGAGTLWLSDQFVFRRLSIHLHRVFFIP